MIVLGIDPGTLHLGWGVVRGLAEVISRHRPSVGSVEWLFFLKDPQAAAKLGHARGVVLLHLARAGMEVMEYPPARVKSTVAGHGRADKQQMVRMVGMLLGLGADLREDAADALALALTYLRRAPVERALAQSTRRPAVLRASNKLVLRPSAKAALPAK